MPNFISEMQHDVAVPAACLVDILRFGHLEESDPFHIVLRHGR